MSKTANKVAIVTGSDSGIGQASAIMLAEQGFDVGVTWRSNIEGAKQTAEQIIRSGKRAETAQLELADPEQGGESLRRLIDRLGRVDVLVNNAGVNIKAEFLDTSYENWRKVFAVNVDGAFVCAQIAARQMIRQGEGGRIINITSVHEHTPLPGSVAYSASKHALGGLTKSMALSLLPYHILVNAVAPGAIATPMNQMVNDDAHKVSIAEIPLGRPGDCREIASMVAWLCSQWSAYTTGQSFIIDGGFMLANPQFFMKKK